MKRAQLSLAGLVFLVVLSLLLLFGQSLARRTLEAVSYTHLKLPTIYSV